MEDERITLRMGQEEVQAMDSFLARRPELGNRSLFIRTAVREYINRDADVSAVQRSPQGNSVERDVCVVFPNGSGEVTVRLPKRMVDTLKIEVDERGSYLNAGELIRSWFTERHVTEEQKRQTAIESFERSDSKTYMQ